MKSNKLEHYHSRSANEQHLIDAVCMWSVIILGHNQFTSDTYRWVDVSAACSCTCNCSTCELGIPTVFCASDNHGCFTGAWPSQVFLAFSHVRVYGVRCTAAFSFYTLSTETYCILFTKTTVFQNTRTIYQTTYYKPATV